MPPNFYQYYLLILSCLLVIQHFAYSLSMISATTTSLSPKLITISEKVWRKAASKHSQQIKTLLQPGLTSLDHVINSGRRTNNRQYQDDWSALDPVNPIYNFLIEYYGLKGAKGPRRLGRWSPDPRLLLDNNNSVNDDNTKSILCTKKLSPSDTIYSSAMKASHNLGGILLENASLDDLGGTLHMRGAIPIQIEDRQSSNNNSDEDTEQPLHGILYNPAIFYNRHLSIRPDDIERRQQILKTLAPFQWYSSILQTTLNSEPILHCYGLHEWAMQYHPQGADPPPSAKYQNSLKLRVSREIINETVERKGIRCTHVDALRFFAPAAGPLNHHGASLERMDQLRLEQKGCVHAHMDLLKIGLKLNSFIDSQLMVDILEVALAARKLDVEASPYDATKYGAGIVPIETNEGRKLYREQQIILMQKAEPIRIRLLEAYNTFMQLAFDEEYLDIDIDDTKHKTKEEPQVYIAPERLSTAQPGGKPWRRSLLEK